VSKKKLKTPKERGVYAFTKHRRGDFILFVKESKKDVLEFMQLPDRYQILLTKEEFTEGLNTKLLDLVEQIPEEVFEVASANIETYQKSS
jgi:phosphoserine aminotransferase